MDENSKDTVWWNSPEYPNDNHPMTEETWAAVKELAKKELNAHPRARHYADRSDWNSTFEVGPYEDYLNEANPAVKPVEYDDHLMVFPYPSTEITKSGGALKQNDGY